MQQLPQPKAPTLARAPTRSAPAPQDQQVVHYPHTYVAKRDIAERFTRALLAGLELFRRFPSVPGYDALTRYLRKMQRYLMSHNDMEVVALELACVMAEKVGTGI